MRRAIIFCLCFFFVIIFGSLLRDNLPVLFTNLASLLFVAGGTLLATIISYPLEKLRIIPGLTLRIYRTPRFDFAAATRDICDLSRAYKRGGFKRLEHAAATIDNCYLRLGTQLVADNCSWTHIRQTIEKERIFAGMQSECAQRVLRSMSRYAPSFGLAGTIIGLIRIFPALSQGADIGGAMSMAMLTTLYGVLLANLLFVPTANKIRDRLIDDELMFRFILEGLRCIREREYSVNIEQRLSALMPTRAAQRISASLEPAESAGVQ